jgi:hypothetical protein
MRTYSSVMALLLRVQYAQSVLLELHVLPIFGFFDRGRRSWSLSSNRSRLQMPVRLMHFSHTCDLLRAEISHFLGCLERYLRIDVIQESTLVLERRLHRLADLHPWAPRAAARRGLDRGDILGSDEALVDPSDLVG